MGRVTPDLIWTKVAEKFPLATNITVEQSNMYSGGVYTVIKFTMRDNFGDTYPFQFEYVDDMLAKINGVDLLAMKSAENILKEGKK